MKSNKNLPYVLTVSGVAGLLASLALVIEKIDILKDPSKQLNCDLNPIIACGPVINTPQAEAFGFGNPLIGLAGFGGLLTVGLMLFAGAKPAKWFWQFIQGGLLLATVFVHWLIFQTIYRVEALCPFCVLVWAVTIISFWYVLVYNLDKGNIKVPSKLKSTSTFVQKRHLDILIVWFLIIVFLIGNHFWYYWKTLF